MGRRKGTAIFVASACVSLVVMGCFLLLFLLYMKATAQAEAVRHDIPYETTFRPGKDESLSVVLLGCEEAESLPELVQLFIYDAPTGTIQIVGIPTQTLCTVDERIDTLAGQYDYQGVWGAVNSVRSLLSYDVDHYLRVQAGGISNLVDFLGGIELNPENTLRIGYQTLSPGRQLLDGRQAASLSFAKDSWGTCNAVFQTELTATLIRQRFNDRLATRLDAFGDAFFYNCESNLSRYDLVMRERGLAGYCNSGLTVNSWTLTGEYSPDYTSFQPDEAGLQAIVSAIQPVTENTPLTSDNIPS